jgi:phage terminase large subunit
MNGLDFTQLSNFIANERQMTAWRTLMMPECKYMLYGGAGGGGKSHFLRWAAVGYGMYLAAKYNMKGIPIGLFSEDYPTLKDRQIIKIKKEFPAWLGQLREDRDLGYLFEVRDKWGGHYILLRNLDDPSKYASVEFAGIFVEELTKNIRSTFDDLRFRLRYPPITDVKFAAGTNPGEIGHGWVKSLWVKPNPLDPDPERERFFYVPAKASDNSYLDESYQLQLEAIKDPQKRAAVKDGSWDVFEGQYFTTWNENLHVVKPFTPRAEFTKFGGIDWGRTKPFAFLAGALEEVTYKGVKFNRMWLYKELYGTDRLPSEWAGAIKQVTHLEEFKEIRCDPKMFVKGDDGAVSIADQMTKEFGPDLKYILERANNDRIPGWENIQNWLSIAPDGLPYLMVSAECVNLIRTIPDMVHDDIRVEDLDTTAEDHALDALRYLLSYIKWINAQLGAMTPANHKHKIPWNKPINLKHFEKEDTHKKAWNTQ